MASLNNSLARANTAIKRCLVVTANLEYSELFWKEYHLSAGSATRLHRKCYRSLLMLIFVNIKCYSYSIFFLIILIKVFYVSKTLN